MDIMENSQTAREVMAVMRTFLLLRDKVVPAPQRPPIEPLLSNGLDSNESQDSQDAYGDMDIDMDDPVLKGLLDGGGATHSDEASLDSDIQSKDKSAAKVSSLFPSSSSNLTIDCRLWVNFHGFSIVA